MSTAHDLWKTTDSEYDEQDARNAAIEAKTKDKFWLAANGLFIARRAVKDPRLAVALSWLIEESDDHDLLKLLKEHTIAEAVEQTEKEEQGHE